MKNIFKGMGVALVTPFKKDGEVDYHKLANLVEYQLVNGADFFCALGSTAETPCLTNDEKLKIKNFLIQYIKGRVPLLMGFGGNFTRQLVADAQDFNFKGIDGLLSVCPYYNKPSQEGIYQHFKTFAKAVSLPVVVYNIPGRTGVNIQPKTLLRLANDVDNIVAVKEASGDIQQVDAILDEKPEDFDVISGDDPITYELISMGGVGVISVMGNAFPGLFGKMVHLLQKDQVGEALKIHRHLFEFYKLLFVDGNPAGVKMLLSEIGLVDNNLRLPLVPVRQETAEQIKVGFKRLKDSGIFAGLPGQD